MALLDRIGDSQSVFEFRRAARLRFAEAERAVEVGDRLIGLYLAGYTAEMTLKAAYFRVIGKASTDPIGLSDLNAVKIRYKLLSGANWPGNLHNLIAWGDLVIAEREGLGTPLGGPLARELSEQVQQVASNWREVLRYHANRPRPNELAATLRAVAWLVVNESRLIR